MECTSFDELYAVESPFLYIQHICTQCGKIINCRRKGGIEKPCKCLKQVFFHLFPEKEIKWSCEKIEGTALLQFFFCSQNCGKEFLQNELQINNLWAHNEKTGLLWEIYNNEKNEENNKMSY